MCLFTHFAAGALAGGVTGNVWLGAAAGLASHALLDAIPHYDHPDWRLELGAGVLSLILLLGMPFASLPAVIGGIFGMVPDLENLFQKLGKMPREKFLFPSHTGLIPHGRRLGPSSLVWQLAIFVFCFGLLGVLNPGSAEAALGSQPVMGEPVVRVLTTDANFTRVQIQCPVERMPGDWETVRLEDVKWGLPEHYVENDDLEGTFLPPRLDLSLAVPSLNLVVTNVIGLEWWKEPSNPVSPADVVTFAAPVLFRSVPLTGCELPLGINGGILRSLVIEVQHQFGQGFSKQFQAGSLEEPADKNADLLDRAPASLLNPDLYTTLARGGRRLLATNKAGEQKGEFNHFDLTANWVRLTINQNGLHHLSGQELSTMGVGVSAVDPNKLRLYRGGSFALDADPTIAESDQAERVGLTEVAIQVLDGDDGEWNLDDEIRFYAFATDFWSDRADSSAGRLEFYNHPYENNGVYWLTWQGVAESSPIPGAPLRVAEVNAPATGGTPVDMAKLRLHLEEQSYESQGVFADNWAWGLSNLNSIEKTFDLHEPVADSLATYVLEFRGYPTGGSSDYQFRAMSWVNSDLENSSSTEFLSGSTYWPYGGQQDSLRVRLVGESPEVFKGSNQITLKSTATPNTYPLVMESIDLYYWTGLNLAEIGGQLEFAHWREQVTVEGQPIDIQVTVPSGVGGIIWDVSDPKNASILTGDLVDSQLVCGLTVSQARDRHFLATTEQRLFRVVSGRRETPLDLRSLPTDVNYIVVYADAFRSPAENLASFRSSSLPGISNPKAIAVSVEDIYDSFSGGQKDMRAIRGYLKSVYENGGGNLRYVCLLGRGTRDPRNYKGLNPNVDLVDLLPVDHRNYFPRNPATTYRHVPYGTDDTMVTFEAPASAFDIAIPTIAIGRLPAVTLSEATKLVERMIEYSSSPEPGLWRNNFLIVADDASTRKGQYYPEPNGDIAHTTHADLLCRSYLPQSLDVRKIFSVAYEFAPGSQGVKPTTQLDINAALSQGTTIYHYVGHGSVDNLSDAQIFRSADIPNLGNGMKRPVFVAFSCDVGVYDNPVFRAMAETFVLAENGGSIGSICASEVSYINENNLLSKNFYANLYPEGHVAEYQTLSESLLRGKALMMTPQYRHNSQRYNLLSDPALVLPNPKDNLSFAETSLDTIRAGTRQVAVLDDDGGLWLGAGDTYSLRVEESGYDHGYVGTMKDSLGIRVPNRWYTFEDDGQVLFNGYGTMNSNELKVPFKVPVQLRYGDRARMRLVLSGIDGDHSANARLSAVRQATGPSDDLIGPQIHLAFEDNRYHVKAGTELIASLQDTSSIAVLGTTPGNKIQLEFDESGLMTDITPSFSFDADSYTTGQVRFPLPGDLSLGQHIAALSARDALGNVGNDTISFVVVADNIMGMNSITLFPNPTPGPCRLIFELSDAMQVKWEIYTLSGHRIKTMQETMSAGPQIIPWDGRDDQGDEIANGTYLYVLRGTVTAGGERDITETGKLVIMH
jgi:Peptidase family C25